MESATEAADEFFTKHCRVVIKDANYEKLKAAEERALRAEFFSSTYFFICCMPGGSVKGS
jgi:hypothetical protein